MAADSEAAAGSEAALREEPTRAERIVRALGDVPHKVRRRAGVTVGTEESGWIGPRLYIDIDEPNVKIRSANFAAIRGYVCLQNPLTYWRETLDACAEALDGERQFIMNTDAPGFQVFEGLDIDEGKVRIELMGKSFIFDLELDEEKSRALLEMIVEVFEEWLQAAESALGEPTGCTAKATGESAEAPTSAESH